MTLVSSTVSDRSTAPRHDGLAVAAASPPGGHGQVVRIRVDGGVPGLREHGDRPQLGPDGAGADAGNIPLDIEQGRELPAKVGRGRKYPGIRWQRDARPVLPQCPGVFEPIHQ
jgi:hypothetical protein